LPLTYHRSQLESRDEPAVASGSYGAASVPGPGTSGRIFSSRRRASPGTRTAARPPCSGTDWGALGFVIAAQSIARFKELDEKGFADYYLIGTLASVLVALIGGVTTGLLIGLL